MILDRCRSRQTIPTLVLQIWLHSEYWYDQDLDNTLGRGRLGEFLLMRAELNHGLAHTLSMGLK